MSTFYLCEDIVDVCCSGWIANNLFVITKKDKFAYIWNLNPTIVGATKWRWESGILLCQCCATTEASSMNNNETIRNSMQTIRKWHKRFNEVHYQCDNYVHRHRDQIFSLWSQRIYKMNLNHTHKLMALLWSLSICELLCINPKMGVYILMPNKKKLLHNNTK